MFIHFERYIILIDRFYVFFLLLKYSLVWSPSKQLSKLKLRRRLRTVRQTLAGRGERSVDVPASAQREGSPLHLNISAASLCSLLPGERSREAQPRGGGEGERGSRSTAPWPNKLYSYHPRPCRHLPSSSCCATTPHRTSHRRLSR